DRVAVVVVVLGGVDPALGGDGVGPPGRIVEGECLDVVAQLPESGSGRGPGQAGPHDDDLEAPLVVRIDETDREPVVVPLVRQRAGRNLGVEARRGLGGDLSHGSASYETE